MKRLLLSFLILSGCSVPQQPEAVTDKNETVVGTLASSGAKVSVTMDFSRSFSAKATADGTPPAKLSDITNLKLYLTTSNTDPLNTADLKYTSAVIAFTGGTSQTFSFSNVPPGGPYYVAVELYSDAGTTNIIEPVAYGGTTGTKGLSVSTNSVTVNADNSVSHNSALTITPQLKAGTGATIDTTVTPQDGPNTTGAITVN